MIFPRFGALLLFAMTVSHAVAATTSSSSSSSSKSSTKSSSSTSQTSTSVSSTSSSSTTSSTSETTTTTSATTNTIATDTQAIPSPTGDASSSNITSLQNPEKESVSAANYALQFWASTEDAKVLKFGIISAPVMNQVFLEYGRNLTKDLTIQWVADELRARGGVCNITLDKPFKNDGNNTLPFELGSQQFCDPPTYRYQVTEWDANTFNMFLTFAHVVTPYKSNRTTVISAGTALKCPSTDLCAKPFYIPDVGQTSVAGAPKTWQADITKYNDDPYGTNSDSP